ncbi:hypothetical protein Taro_019825 [Colocasia esculenta]|uniref:Uncharacterized protein n=1 Tax=Colocasia esculenta TaxID=4460 RepID=A0A843UXA4_COLES|nr:hypothetical protein [Colocasia esculenta]
MTARKRTVYLGDDRWGEVAPTGDAIGHEGGGVLLDKMGEVAPTGGQHYSLLGYILKKYRKQDQKQRKADWFSREEYEKFRVDL